MGPRSALARQIRGVYRAELLPLGVSSVPCKATQLPQAGNYRAAPVTSDSRQGQYHRFLFLFKSSRARRFLGLGVTRMLATGGIELFEPAVTSPGALRGTRARRKTRLRRAVLAGTTEDTGAGLEPPIFPGGGRLTRSARLQWVHRSFRSCDLCFGVIIRNKKKEPFVPCMVPLKKGTLYGE